MIWQKTYLRIIRIDRLPAQASIWVFGQEKREKNRSVQIVHEAFELLFDEPKS